MHELESALGEAAPGRESSWRAAVLGALAVLDEATGDEYINATKPDSLFGDIKRTQPRLRTRVRGLRTQYAQLRQTIMSIGGIEARHCTVLAVVLGAATLRRRTS